MANISETTSGMVMTQACNHGPRTASGLQGMPLNMEPKHKRACWKPWRKALGLFAPKEETSSASGGLATPSPPALHGSSLSSLPQLLLLSITTPHIDWRRLGRSLGFGRYSNRTQETLVTPSQQTVLLLTSSSFPPSPTNGVIDIAKLMTRPVIEIVRPVSESFPPGH